MQWLRFRRRRLRQTRYILCVLQLLRKESRFFLAGLLAAVALRLFFVMRFPGVVDDSRLYADIAMNWLQHGIYGITDSGHVVPTLSRLPGYPAFLAVVFSIFGWENFRAVLLIQVLFDLGTSFIIADLARRIFSGRAAKAAFLLAALCPFLANYSAAALTETLEVFFTALALDLTVCGFEDLRRDTSVANAGWWPWIACGLSIGACILLRPDGGILLAAVGGYVLLLLARSVFQPTPQLGARTVLRAGVVITLSALAPLLPWTLRNLHTLHRLQPLAPRYANDADEPTTVGFNRWTKTWIADYTSVEETYWNVPGASIDVARLPRRAFDSPRQQEETTKLFADYNGDHDLTPDLDARFAALAEERIRNAPLRFHVWLPAVRIADMWLRPRTELLASDPRWWEFNDEWPWLTVSIGFGLINLLYVGAAIAGSLRWRRMPLVGLFALFVTLRSLFLGTLENPEPRYTLECYPVVILAAAALLIGKSNRTHRKPA